MLYCGTLPGLTLKEHQTNIARFMNHTTRKGLVLFHDTGTGKSITSIAIVSCLLTKNRRRNRKTAYIITPASVVKQFENELTRAQLPDDVRDRIKVWSHQKWLNAVQKGEIDPTGSVIVVDEAHKFRTPVRTVKKKVGDRIVMERVPKYTLSLLRAAYLADKVVMMTATPTVNRPIDVANYMAVLNETGVDPDVTEYATFKDGTGSVPAAEEYLRCAFSRQEKNRDDFPSVREKTIKVRMSAAYSKMYQEIDNNLPVSPPTKEIFGDKTEEQLKAFLNAKRRAVNKIKHASPKVRWCVKKISDEAKKNNKSIVYSAFLDNGVKMIVEELEKKQVSHAMINGSTSKADRFALTQRYNAGDIHVLIVSSAGAEGIDTKGTANVILLEPFWHTSRTKQVIGRAVRSGSHAHLPPNKRHVTVYKLISIPAVADETKFFSIDQYMDALQTKKEVNTKEITEIIERQSIESLGSAECLRRRQ